MLSVLPHRTFTVKRFGPTTTTSSGTTPGTQSSVFCIGTLISCSPSEIARLEEGKRSRQAFKLITDAALNVANAGGQLPDWLSVNGTWFEVSNSNPWENGVMTHQEYIITKIENPGDYGTL